MVETMTDNELRPAARSVVELARSARTPNDAHRQRAYQALVAGLGGGAAVGTAKVAAAAGKVAANSAFAWVKWAILAALVASGGVGAYLWSSPHEPAPPPSVHRAPATPAPAIAAPSLPSAEVAPPEAANAVAEASGKPATLPPKAGAKPSGDALVQEISLLHEALAASRSGNAVRALELAREHAKRYPGSRLAIERSSIEVRSLCSLGRVAEARKIADRLRAQSPSSPLIASLKDTCVGK
jgi:hypothetical protein